MTKDLVGNKNKITLPDGSEQYSEVSKDDRPKWPYKHAPAKQSNCPFSLIYKKWIVVLGLY